MGLKLILAKNDYFLKYVLLAITYNSCAKFLTEAFGNVSTIPWVYANTICGIAYGILSSKALYQSIVT